MHVTQLVLTWVGRPNGHVYIRIFDVEYMRNNLERFITGDIRLRKIMQFVRSCDKKLYFALALFGLS